jgi:hypothetical protein
VYIRKRDSEVRGDVVECGGLRVEGDLSEAEDSEEAMVVAMWRMRERSQWRREGPSVKWETA